MKNILKRFIRPLLSILSKDKGIENEVLELRINVPEGLKRAVMKREGIPHVSRKKLMKYNWAKVNGEIVCLNY